MHEKKRFFYFLNYNEIPLYSLMLKLDDIACKIQSFILLDQVQKPSFYFQQFAKMVVIQTMVLVQHQAPACKLNIKLCTLITQ